jgi:hypothetical protein
MNVCDKRGRKKSGNDALDALSIHHIGIQHHTVGIISTQGQESRAHDLGHFVYSVVDILGAFSDKYCVSSPIRRIGWLANVIEKQEFLTDESVTHFDAVWEARLLVGDVPLDPM